MTFETAYYSALVVGALFLAFVYRDNLRRLWSRLPSPWATAAALLVGGVALGATAGQPLIGLLAGAILAALVVFGPAATPRPAPAAATYDEPEESADEPNEGPFSPFERAEQPLFVQPVQPPNEPNDLTQEERHKLEALGAAMAGGLIKSEAAAIEVAFPGVKRGGSKRYEQLRDELRASAARQGWKQPEPPAPAPPAEEPPRRIPIADGKQGYVEMT